MSAFVTASLLCGPWVPLAGAQTGANVLVVFNTRHSSARQLAEHYARARSVPPENLVALNVDAATEIARADYEQSIELPIGRAITRANSFDRILYILLVKGIPLRIAGSNGLTGTVASVDSELTLLYRKLTGRGVSSQGRIPNPYFLDDRAVSSAKPFSHAVHDIYLVSRLDAFTVDDVVKLVDRGASPVTRGNIVLDQKSTLIDRGGDRWLQMTAERLREAGAAERIMLESSTIVVQRANDVLGYYSWGSNDPENRLRRPELAFVPGALVATFVSSDARTFEEPPSNWSIGNWDDRTTYFAGSPQSLIGDLLRQGATGAAGHVAEPFLDATVRPQILFPAYLAGFNLVESYYLAMPFLSWQTIVVGDPLCAPFRMQSLSASEIDKGLDQDTELPSFFSPRRVEAAIAGGANPATVRLGLRAESRLAADNKQGARESLEALTAVDPRPVAAQVTLANLYEEIGDFDRAIERYRQVLKTSPDEVAALNNLAYALAVHKQRVAEALPLAERAYELSKANPLVADTLGWIQHLSGNSVLAAKLLTEAVGAAPPSAEIHFHLAAVLAVTGDRARAASELKRALELNPEMANRDDVKATSALLAR